MLLQIGAYNFFTLSYLFFYYFFIILKNIITTLNHILLCYFIFTITKFAKHFNFILQTYNLFLINDLKLCIWKIRETFIFLYLENSATKITNLTVNQQ
jgi:hypothetical protein